MTGWIRDSRGGRGILAMLFLFALVVRMIVPTGFMPTTTPAGIVISMCTGMGAVKTFLPIEQDGDKSDRQTPADGPCIYAGGAGGGLPDADVVVPAPMVAPNLHQVVPYAFADIATARLAAPPPPAIGPPALG